MSVIMILTEPMPEQIEDGQSVPPRLVLGPFNSVTFEDGNWHGDGQKIAEVFQETMTDMMNCVVGHPSAGNVFVPRTFRQDEHDHPDFPGKGYEKVEVVRA